TLRALYLWNGPQTLLQINDPAVIITPDVLPWASQSAMACYHDFERLRDERIDAETSLRPYVARAGEIAVRLATIRAAGRRGPGAQVDRDDIEWGVNLAWTTGLALAEAAMAYMPENERQIWGDKILNLIKRRGTAKVRDIQMHIRGAIRSSEIK